MTWAIPVADVEISERDVEAVLDCYRSGWLTMGPRTAQFELQFAGAVGAEHAVAVSSGTAALHLALLGAGIAPGDEVLLPAMTFVAAAAMVRACGATPVFVDSIGDDDLNMDPAHAASLISPRTRAILATHWWGYPCDIEALQTLCDTHGLVLLEDAAQAVLADVSATTQAGCSGHAGCFSLFADTQLCVGEGGVVTTPDVALAAKVRSLRSHAMTSVTWDRHRGHEESYDVVDIGFNYRIDEPRAALALSRLPRLRADIEHRRSLVRAYREQLCGLEQLTIPWDDAAVMCSSHFCFGVVLGDERARDALRATLAAHAIQTTVCPSITSFSAYAGAAGGAPVAEGLGRRHVALPLASGYAPQVVERVCAAVREALH